MANAPKDYKVGLLVSQMYHTIVATFHSITIKQRKFSYLTSQTIWSVFLAAVPSFAVGKSRKHVMAFITVVSKNLTSTTRSFASTPWSFDSSTRRLKKIG